MAIRICYTSVAERNKINSELAEKSDLFGKWMGSKGFDLKEQQATWQQIKAATVGVKSGQDGNFRIEHLQKIDKVITRHKKNLTRERSNFVQSILLPQDRAKDWALVEKFNEGIFESVNKHTGDTQANAASYRNFWKYIATGAAKLGATSKTNPLGKIYKTKALNKVVSKMFSEYDTAQANGDINLARELYEGNRRKNIIGIKDVMEKGQGKIFKEVYDLVIQPRINTGTKRGYKEFAKQNGYSEAAINAAEVWHTELHPRGIKQIANGIRSFEGSIKNKRHLFGDLKDKNGNLLYDATLNNFKKIMQKYNEGQVQREGFYPILSMEVLPSLAESSRLIFHPEKSKNDLHGIKDLKKGASILEKILGVFEENLNLHTQLRERKIDNSRASANIFYTLDAYSKNASRFNMVSSNSANYLKIMESLHKFEGTAMENKMHEMERFIDHQYSIISGTRAGDNKALNDITRAITSWQFFSKLGLNFRSWARNATQSLLNYVHFGGIQIAKSWSIMKDPKMKSRINSGLLDNGIMFADLKESYMTNMISTSNYNPKKGVMETKLDDSYLHRFADSIDRMAELTGQGMQIIENKVNRKMTYSIAYSLGWNNMKNNNTYHESLFRNQLDIQLKKEGMKYPERKRLKDNDYKDLEEGRTHTRFKENDSTHMEFLYENYLRKKANNAGVWATRELHYDYSATGKSQFLTSKPGAIMFQFQHYSMNYFNYQRKIARNYMEDLSSGLWNTPEGGRAFRIAMLYGVLIPLFEVGVPGGARFSNLVQNDTAERINQLAEAILDGQEGDYEGRVGKGSQDFYGKGPVVGLLGGPMIGDLVTINNLANLYDLDEDGWTAMLTGYQDYSDKSTNEKWQEIWKTINRGTFRISDFFTGGGNLGSSTQKEFGLFPNQTITNRRKKIGNFINDKFGIDLRTNKPKPPPRRKPRGVDYSEVESSLRALEGRTGGRDSSY
jgi:hypothetical protein